MKNFKLILEYDGRAFNGWQRQAQGGGSTVQGVLEEALSRLCNHPVTLHGSGRTDAGVHARAQVASFQTDSGRTAAQIIKGTNTLLPPSVAILAAEEMPPQFHARFNACGKRYEYEYLLSPTRRPLFDGRAWWVGSALDWAAAKEALPHLLGEKDFAAFQSAGSDVQNTVRCISQAELSLVSTDLMRLSLTGSGFLRHMVRAIAGVLAEIGRGRLCAVDMAKIIEAKDRSQALTAPAGGLYLAEVFYSKMEPL